MTREIAGLERKVYDRLIEEIPDLFIACDNEPDQVYVILNEAVIVKAYDDVVVLDLGGKKSFVNPETFISMSFT